MQELFRRWWPIGLFVGLAIVGGIVFTSFFDAKGHAAGHLGSAGVIFPMTAAFAILVWALPRYARGVGVWSAGVLLLAGLLAVCIGNVQVVNAIGSDNWSDKEADALGPARAGFNEGHDLATIGMYVSVLATIMLAIVLVLSKQISGKVAATAIVLSILFPPWIIPGFGLFVLTIALCMRKAREEVVV